MKKIIYMMFRGIGFILLFISGLVLSLYYYFRRKTFELSFEQILYNISQIRYSNIESASKIVYFCIPALIIFLVITIIIYTLLLKYSKKKKDNNKHMGIGFLLYSFVIFISCLIFVMWEYEGFQYLSYYMDNSNIFDKYYVDPRGVKLTFPSKKKNLIYIYVESLETSNVSKEFGGLQEISLIPNLEGLANDNINFSNGDRLGGAIQTTGVGWTIAGMIAHTAGIPLKIRIESNSYQGYSEYLGGAYSLGDVLENNGYNNYIMMGSAADFAGKSEYFTDHGNYEILDLLWAWETGVIPEDYDEWWGFEDSKLFKFAKDKLLEIANQNEPFNFTILTADTHFVDGYIDKSCEDDLPFDMQYANSFYCSDRQLGEFIKWIKEQDFYKDTVIIISGDHLTMQSDFYPEIDYEYQRTVYNAFINTQLSNKTTKNRLFTTMDMYPTTLAALGIKIDGNKLGLGTNLFSGEKTLIETIGEDTLERELVKNSKYYNKYILGNSYNEMYRDIIKEKKK